MTRLDEVTGSPDRSTAVLAMVAEAIRDGNASFENAASKTGRYNNFGELYDDEFQVALTMLQPAEFDPADVQVEPVQDADTSADGIVHASDQDAVRETRVATAIDVPIMTRDEANVELKRRTEALMAARKSRMVAEDAQEQARKVMEQLRSVWKAGGPTSDQIRRNEIAAINADRGAAVAQRQSRPGPSYFDRQRFHAGRGDAADFARQSPPLTEAAARKLGGHGPGTKGNARGGFPKNYIGRSIRPPSEG